MNVNTTQQEPETAADGADREMLKEVYRRLVAIHASAAERTRSDPEIMPWTVQELMSLIRDVGAFWREQGVTPASLRAKPLATE